jgi:hypothetical protein
MTRVQAGKGSRTASNFQRLRSRIRMPGDQSGEDGAVTPVKPVPEPVKYTLTSHSFTIDGRRGAIFSF